MPCCIRVGAESRNGPLDSLIVPLDVHKGLSQRAIYVLMRTADFLRILFLKKALYNISITLCKISVLFFFRHTFAITWTVQLCL